VKGKESIVWQRGWNETSFGIMREAECGRDITWLWSHNCTGVGKSGLIDQRSTFKCKQRIPSPAHTPLPTRHPVSFPASILAQCLFPTVSESSNPGRMDDLGQGSVMGERSAGAQEDSCEEKGQRMCFV